MHEAMHGYSKIYTIGTKWISGLLLDPVVIEEKIDGSQLSFGIDGNGELRARSRTPCSLCVTVMLAMFVLALLAPRRW